MYVAPYLTALTAHSIAAMTRERKSKGSASRSKP